MLKICETEAHYLDMKFNVAKSMILRVGYSYAIDCAKLAIDGCELQFVGKLKYLGVYLLCGKKLRLSLHEYKAKFFRALNGILYRVKGFSNDIVIMHLIQSYCKPLLLYACECFNMTCSEISQLCKAWRCVYWKVFKVSTDEPIELIQVNTGLCALDTELSHRKSSFVHKMSCSTNSVMYGLSVLRL